MPFPDENFAEKARKGDLDAPPLPDDKQDRTAPHGDAKVPAEQLKPSQELVDAIEEVAGYRKTSLSVREAREQEEEKARRRRAEARKEAIDARTDTLVRDVQAKVGYSNREPDSDATFYDLHRAIEALCAHIARLEFEMSDVKTVADHADFMTRPI